MSKKELRTHADGRVLFDGAFRSVRTCAEEAVARGISLAGVDLSNANLSGANLDGADMRGARLTGANLTGANLSEARFDHADFREASLYNACLAWSNCAGCDFRFAGFGATDIAGTDLSGGRFAGLATFSLDFVAARSLAGAHCDVADGRTFPMERPPVAILGLSRPVAILDTALLIGNEPHRTDDADPVSLPKRALLNSGRLADALRG